MSKSQNTTKICKHSKIEIFEDDDGRGFFAECSVCDGVGPLEGTKQDARAALKALQVERPSNQGGIREGAGRKKKLPDDAKVTSTTLFPVHFRKIDKFLAQFNKTRPESKHLVGRSAALRRILDDLKI